MYKVIRIIFSYLFIRSFVLSRTNASDPESPGTGTLGDRPFILNDMDGNTYNLHSILDKGTNVALVFWQTWCAACMREAPALERAARDHAGAIQFFGVIPGGDEFVDENEVREVVKRFKLPYPQIQDRDVAITKKYKVIGTPYIVILNSDKTVLYQGHKPPKDWTVYHRENQ